MADFADAAELNIGNVVAEHAIGTTQENLGYVKSPTTPAIDMDYGYQDNLDYIKTASGDAVYEGLSDPNVRFEFEAKFQTVPKSFINDLMVLQDWNYKGYKIVIRPNMFGVFPSVMYCDIDVQQPTFLEQSHGQGVYDVVVKIKEAIV